MTVEELETCCETTPMPKRNLQIVTQTVPFIGFCEACNAQFRSYKPKREDAEQIIKSAFAAHNCAEAPKNDPNARSAYSIVLP